MYTHKHIHMQVHTHARKHTHTHARTHARTHTKCILFINNLLYWLNFLSIHIMGDTTSSTHTYLSVDILKLIQQIYQSLTVSLKDCLSQRELSKNRWHIHNTYITPEATMLCTNMIYTVSVDAVITKYLICLIYYYWLSHIYNCYVLFCIQV